jgi:LysR family transcriptional regulator for metE and metH
VERIEKLPTPRLDVRDLRLVLAIVAAGSTAKAASLLHLTQPAVSRALLAAEDKIGVSLFDRTPRGLTLTAAGERLAAGAQRLLVEWLDLEHRVRAPEPEVTQLRIVCECYTAYHWLPSALLELRQSLPDLDVSLAVEHTGAPVEALEAGHVDVALLTTADVPRGSLQVRSLFSDEVVFLVASSHPLAKKKALTRDDLRAHIMLSGNTPPAEVHWFMTRVFGRSRPRLRIDRLPLTEAILDVARAGLGIAVLSEWMVGPHLAKGDLVAKRMTSGPLLRPWRLAWRRDVGDAATRLLSALGTVSPRAVLAS